MAHGTTEKPSGSDVLQVQHQIRANASELQDYFADLYSWEKKINKEDAVRKTPTAQATTSSAPLPRERKVATVTATPVAEQTAELSAKPADAHTYDKGYKKWDKFDVDAALRDEDEERPAPTPTPVVAQANAPSPKKPVAAAAVKKVVAATPKAAPPAVSSGKSREEIEKEEGNDHYKHGDYVAAIKSYTRALGFNSRNVVVLSNRAMAYLKNREYSKAEEDCSLALKMDATHVKSLSRRATARNSLGKHRLALLDFERALALDPKSKQILSQLASTKEQMRNAIKRTPKRTTFSIKVIGEPTHLDDVASPFPEDKENAMQSANTGTATKIQVVETTPPSTPALMERMPLVAAAKAEATKTPPPAAPTQRMVTRPVAASSSSSSTEQQLPLPKIPTKVPTTSYEFLRVWKTLAPKGDADRVAMLLHARGRYLRQLPPASLPAVFKNSIESELLCDIFATVRHAFDLSAVAKDRAYVLDLIHNLPRVPRFSMTILFLSDKEKVDCAWVFERLLASETHDPPSMASLQAVKPQYGLK